MSGVFRTNVQASGSMRWTIVGTKHGFSLQVLDVACDRRGKFSKMSVLIVNACKFEGVHRSVDTYLDIVLLEQSAH